MRFLFGLFSVKTHMVIAINIEMVINLFVRNHPTKLDIDVLRSIENVGLDPDVHQHIIRWKNLVTSYSENVRSRYVQYIDPTYEIIQPDYLYPVYTEQNYLDREILSHADLSRDLENFNSDIRCIAIWTSKQ